MATKKFSSTFNLDPSYIYSLEEQKKIINTSRKMAVEQGSTNFRDDIILRILFETGRRVSEVVGQQPTDTRIYKGKRKKIFTGELKDQKLVAFGLTPRDLKPETNEVIFQKLKKKKVDKIMQPISPQLMSDIVDHVNKFRIMPNKRVFAIRRDRVFRILKKVCEKAGITFRGVHAIRHCFAISFVKNMEDSSNLYDLQEILGHSDVSVTMTYLKYGNKKARETLKKVQDSLLLESTYPESLHHNDVT